MPINEKYTAGFEPGNIYHIYSKAIGREQLFLSDENKRYFLQKYSSYSYGYFDTHAYCLLDNHFHIAVRAKPKLKLINFLSSHRENQLKQHQLKFVNGEISFETALELQFKDFLISYAQAFNKAHHRTGPLFVNPFKRILVADENHYTNLVIYIHANTLKHKVNANFEQYKWSSYNSLISESSTLLQRNEVLDWFGGREKFIEAHRLNSDYLYASSFE